MIEISKSCSSHFSTNFPHQQAIQHSSIRSAMSKPENVGWSPALEQQSKQQPLPAKVQFQPCSRDAVPPALTICNVSAGRFHQTIKSGGWEKKFSCSLGGRKICFLRDFSSQKNRASPLSQFQSAFKSPERHFFMLSMLWSVKNNTSSHKQVQSLWSVCQLVRDVFQRPRGIAN